MGKCMFSPDVVGTDAFLDLPDDAQLLYYRLGLEGTYGKIQGIRRIARSYGLGNNTLRSLYDAGYLFDCNGACWVRHYWLNNTYKSPNHKYATTMPEIVSGEIGFEGEPFKSAFICPEVDKASVRLTQGYTGTGTDPEADPDPDPDPVTDPVPEAGAGEGAHGEGEADAFRAQCHTEGCGKLFTMHGDGMRSWGTCEHCGRKWSFSKTGGWEEVE